MIKAVWGRLFAHLVGEADSLGRLCVPPLFLAFWWRSLTGQFLRKTPQISG